MSPFDPYAPPRDVPAPSIDRPLPEGIRRYRLDPEGATRILQRAVLVRLGFSAVIAAVYASAFAWSGRYAVGPYVGTWIVILTLGTVLRRAGARRGASRFAAAFELLSSPRALRRSALHLAPSEIAAVEVTSMAELTHGLSVVAETRRLWIPREIDAYAELRDRVAAWGPIETLGGPRALLRRLSHVRVGRAYDLATDGAIAREPSLRGEIDALRAVSVAPASNALGHRARRALILWLALIVFFFALARILSSKPATPRRARPLPTPGLPM